MWARQLVVSSKRELFPIYISQQTHCPPLWVHQVLTYVIPPLIVAVSTDGGWEFDGGKGEVGDKMWGEMTDGGRLYERRENMDKGSQREWGRKKDTERENTAGGESRVERNQAETTSLLRLTTYTDHPSAQRTRKDQQKQSSRDHNTLYHHITHWQKPTASYIHQETLFSHFSLPPAAPSILDSFPSPTPESFFFLNIFPLVFPPIHHCRYGWC